MKIKAWLSAVRLRTLPLSVSGILAGTGLAGMYGYADVVLFVWALLATLGLQIISNLANDYGDGVKGTDNKERIGPERTLQSGALSAKELKNGIVVAVLLTVLIIGFLLWRAFEKEPLYYLFFTFLGVLSVWAAIRYTVGDAAYGYKGLGDVFVFCFFGLLSVLGTMFLFTKFIEPDALLPAFSVGFLSTAVLNLNNMRDYLSDAKAGKNTLVVKVGLPKAKRYHYFLLLGAFFSMSFFLFRHARNWQQLLCMLAFIPVFIHFVKVLRTKQPGEFDPELKKLALSTFFMAFFFYLGFNYFL